MLFDIVGTSITVKPELLAVPEFKKIWDRDKTKDKKIALNELSYIVFLSELSKRNPYRNYSESDRKEMLTIDFNITEDILITEAVDKFKKLSSSRYKRLVTAALDSSDELVDYYNNIKSTDPDFDPNDYLNTLTKLSKSVKELRELEKQLEVDNDEESGKVRGQSEIGDYEL